MKSIPYLMFAAALVFGACKSETKTAKDAADQAPSNQSILEKVAYANGYDHWKDVNELRFTFNVDRDTSHYERTWVWKPKSNTVTAISEGDTLTYDRKDMDSVAYKTNGGFINDKYWLMAPINILWDEESLTYEHSEQVEAPLSGNPMQKLTVVYGDEGGYTPGDAYDFYFGDDYRVQEWAFRRGNQPEPSMVTTWEDYQDAGGLHLARMHQNEDGSFKLYFTDVSVNTN